MATYGHEGGYAFNEDQRGGHCSPSEHGCDGPCEYVNHWCPECDCKRRCLIVNRFCIECTECQEPIDYVVPLGSQPDKGELNDGG